MTEESREYFLKLGAEPLEYRCKDGCLNKHSGGQVASEKAPWREGQGLRECGRPAEPMQRMDEAGNM